MINNVLLIFLILLIQLFNRKIKNLYFLNLNILSIFIVICYTEFFLVKFDNVLLRNIVFLILFILFAILSFSYVKIKNNCIIIKKNLFTKSEIININEIISIEYKEEEYFEGNSSSIILVTSNRKYIEISFIYVSFMELINKLKLYNNNININNYKEIKKSDLFYHIAFFITNIIITMLLINGFGR